jgi:hypothetical protein
VPLVRNTDTVGPDKWKNLPAWSKACGKFRRPAPSAALTMRNTEPKVLVPCKSTSKLHGGIVNLVTRYESQPRPTGNTKVPAFASFSTTGTGTYLMDRCPMPDVLKDYY